jgi:hypothetical protein
MQHSRIGAAAGGLLAGLAVGTFDICALTNIHTANVMTPEHYFQEP